ncbi:hypothetical protein Dalk_4942 [Desulfatibacillum aliphaticivorans]|uniref:Uncharacterized protein n=1 Tax=Desulfatibacillum aliphaticivorans TaxID=218208 RepID=B8FDI3_DESAL|nr:hypothetical protein [Desulfatibacillum aliphaticivorans]ACL06614.1 hypothetical protein Dalk_4942 [Desulfatibacillum aliphaticivorans]
MLTKKFSAAVSYGDFKTKSKEFLIPFLVEEESGFQGLSSGKAFDYGVMAFIGREIDADDIFKKLVDSGQKISNVQTTLKVLERYISEVQQFKIGNIVRIEYGRELNFSLIKEADRPGSTEKNKSKLP